MVSPEIVQIIATLAGAIVFYIRVQGQIDKAKSDAESRENQIKSDALSRESKIKSDAIAMKNQLEAEAERIQQESQRIVNETATQLRTMVVAQSEQSIADGQRYDNLTTKYEVAMEKLADAIQQLHAAELRSKDDQNEKMTLEQTVIDLKNNMAELEGRICALEEDNTNERNKRLAAEKRATIAEERANVAETKLLPVGLDEIETQHLPSAI